MLPAVYLGYHAGYLLLQTQRTVYNRGVRIESPVGFAGTVLLLVMIGGAVGVTWTRGLRVPGIFAGIELAVLPWAFPLSPLDAFGIHLLWVVTTIAVAAGLEEVVRSSRPTGSGLDRAAIRVSIAVGGLHLAIGVAVQLLTRTSPLWPRSVFGFAIITGGLLGTALTGGLPAYLWNRYGLWAPVITLGVWLAWAAARLLARLDELPYTEATTIRHTGVQPFPDYMLQWPILLVVLVLTATGEYILRTRPQPVPT